MNESMILTRFLTISADELFSQLYLIPPRLRRSIEQLVVQAADLANPKAL